MKTAIVLLLLAAGCKRSAPPSGAPADARAAAAADARLRAIDASRPQDAAITVAQPVDAAATPDAGARRPKPRPPLDAAPVAIDAAPPPPSPPDGGVAPGACHRTTFDTKLVAAACEKGGQGAAKAAMKKFVRAAKKQEASLECKSCHTKLAPAYPLKDDALEHFRRLGGE
jgi:hypothetical protein